MGFILSAMLLAARQLPPGGRLVCVEANPDCVAAMEGVLSHAGLRDKIIIEQGLSGDVVPRLMETYGPSQLLFEVCQRRMRVLLPVVNLDYKLQPCF